MKKNIIFLSMFVLLACVTLSAFDLMGAIKNAAEDTVKETVKDAVTKKESQAEPSQEKAIEKEKNVSGAADDSNAEPEESEETQATKASAADTEVKSEPVKKTEYKTVKSVKTSSDVPPKYPSIEMISVDDSNIVNFRKDKKTIATWIYKDDDTIEKKGESVEGWVKGVQQYNYVDVNYAIAYIKFKNNEIIDGPVVWKAGEKTWKEMQYRNGKLFGEYREYYEKSGDLKVVKNYGENGKQECVKKYYYEGMIDTLKREIVMAAGKAVSYKDYYEDGKLMEEGGYDGEGYKSGLSRIYSTDGEEGQVLYKSGKKIGIGTKEKPIDPQAYDKIDGILKAVSDGGFQYEVEQGNVAAGSNAMAAIKGKEFSMHIIYVSDKKDQKDAEEQLKSAGTLASIITFSQKSKAVIANYFKDQIAISVFSESKDTGKSIEAILKKVVPGIRKK